MGHDNEMSMQAHSANIFISHGLPFTFNQINKCKIVTDRLMPRKAHVKLKPILSSSCLRECKT